jgi:predicted permease
MAPAGLLNSFLAAIQASLSVLLVIFYGAIAAHLKLLDAPTAKAISKICVKMFLPALLLTKIGSELHAGKAHLYGLILVWAFVCHFISFLIGIAAHLFLGMPDWITAAIMFNNTTSYPLLLIQSLDETGILSYLIVTDETTRDAIERAKSYFLVFATVSSCLTFAVGPRLIDSEHAAEPEDDKDDDEDEETGTGEQSTERTGLLSTEYRRASVVPTTFFPTKPRENPPTVQWDRRPSLITKRRWIHLSDRARWWLLFLYDFLNAPLIGAVLGAIIGLVPALHRSFFSDTADGGIFSAWLTASLKNVGSVFVPLPVVVAGVSLYLSMQAARSGAAQNPNSNTPWTTTLFVLVIRFLIWPVASIGIIYSLAKHTDILGQDPMLWFTMMLMPTGPSAMKLITMVQASDADEEDEHKIAKLLTVGVANSEG